MPQDLPNLVSAFVIKASVRKGFIQPLDDGGTFNKVIQIISAVVLDRMKICLSRAADIIAGIKIINSMFSLLGSILERKNGNVSGARKITIHVRVLSEANTPSHNAGGEHRSSCRIHFTKKKPWDEEAKYTGQTFQTELVYRKIREKTN